MKKLGVGIVGLGRLGKEYAKNLAWKIPSVELVAACSLSSEELSFARDSLDVHHLYTDFEKMLSQSDIEAVFVVSSTDRHATHMTQALDAGKHVFCEKPLALDVAACIKVQETAEQHPDLKAVVGFVRRFDPSYRYAKDKIDAGAIGEPFLVRSQTVDKDSVSDFQIKYVHKSGGIFHDFNVHDIDLARWYLGSELLSAYSIGGSYKHDGFAALGDADNVMTTCQMVNGTMAVINASRTAAHGHDTYTEVVGTEGTLRIGRPAGKNRVEIYDQHGARKECVETFWERFSDGFLLMAEDFIDCVINDRTPELTIQDAIKATEAAIAFTESFRQKQVIQISHQYL